MRASRRLALLVAVMLAALAVPAQALTQTQLSPEAFLDRLDRAGAIARLEDEPPSPGRMAELREILGLPAEIVIDGWTTELPADPILEGLAGTSAADFDEASVRLSVLARSVSDAASREGHPPDRIAAALGGAYSGVVRPPPDLISAVLRTFDDVLQAVVQRLEGTLARAGSGMAWIVLIVIVVLAGAALLRAGFVPDRGSDRGSRDRDGATSVDWMARGEAALRAGELQEAIRAFYVALLVALAAKGIVADAPALTAGETRVAVRRVRPELFPVIADVTRTYERVVYGGDTPNAQDALQLREATTRVSRR